MKKAYGFVEMKGLASAVVAADTALKAANVKLDGLEPAKGQGMHTLKLTGEVSSVKAAVNSIMGNIELQGRVYSCTVIARPSEGLELMIVGRDELMRKEATKKEKVNEKEQVLKENETKNENGGAVEKSREEAIAVSNEKKDTDEILEKLEKEEVFIETNEQNEEVSEEEEEAVPMEPGPSSVEAVQAPMEEEKAPEERIRTTKRKTATCNLCGDSSCPRVKGEPRVKCIHYKEKE